MDVSHSEKDDRKYQEKLQQGGIIPGHIAIIMDGNGRWAKERGLPRAAGHSEGINSVRDIVEVCGQLGIGFLTLYTFSTENWKRPSGEVTILMRLLLKALRDETDRLQKNNVRLNVIGNLSSMPEEVRQELRDGIERTKGNTGLQLNLALSYSGRWDIVQACRSIGREIQRGTLTPEEITDAIVDHHLSTGGIPEPDLMIRTGGELRISNFLLWQLAYTELYVSPVFWPAFRRKQLYEAIEEFQRRERRFGLISEQIETRPT